MKNIIISSLLIGFVFLRCEDPVRAADTCNDHVIISQIYGGGGNSGAMYKNDFIELYNPTTEDVSMENWSVQYATANGSFASANITSLSNGIIKAKSYYLIAEAKGSGDAKDLPTPDKSGVINLSASAGKVALAHSVTAISSETDPMVVDFINYSSGSNTKSIFHGLGTCPNTYSTDIPNPRNSSVVETDDESSLSEDDPVSDETTSDGYSPDTTEKCAVSSQDIKLNEIFPYPENDNEFVEITNTGGSCVDISGWKIIDEAGHKKEFPGNSTVGPGEYFFLEGNLYLNNDSDTIYLLGANETAKSDALDRVFYEKSQKGFSYSFDGKNWRWTSSPTPTKENIITTTDSKEGADDPVSEENYSAAENVYLNEILPNPKGGLDNEYIEIASGESGPVDLFGWRIKDGSKSKGYQFKEHIVLNSGEYFVIYHPNSKITLNNSDESVNLHNPQGEVVSSAAFDKSRKDTSFNFDGKNWKWSKYLTPGKENKFDSVPSVKITKPKYAFKGLYTDFSAKAKDKETKKLGYIWDFGDGKKSYLAKTSHKYLDTGKYTVTLTVDDDSQTVEKSFVLAVKNYPRPDLEIERIVPNPVGNDSDGEIVEIRNNSSQKIELQGWKIASGSDDKIYNHPISGEISLEPNETKTITREICKFSLNNKAGKIQLVMPDGKVTNEVEYTKEKIEEGEAYVTINGEWQWIAPTEIEITEKEKPSEEGSNMVPNEETVSDAGEVLGVTDENIPYYASPQTEYTPGDAYIFFKLTGLLDYKLQERNYCPVNKSSLLLANI